MAKTDPLADAIAALHVPTRNMPLDVMFADRPLLLKALADKYTEGMGARQLSRTLSELTGQRIGETSLESYFRKLGIKRGL